MNAKPKKERQTKNLSLRTWAPLVTLLLVATGLASTGTALEAAPQNEKQVDAGVVCTNPGPIQSGGEFLAVGTFWTCSMGLQAVNTYSVSFRYCYLGDTHGRTASITTLTSAIGSGAFSPVDTKPFTTPYTGNGGCTNGSVGTYGSHSFTTTGLLLDQMRWDYLNGDWKVSIANIVVSTTLI